MHGQNCFPAVPAHDQMAAFAWFKRAAVPGQPTSQLACGHGGLYATQMLCFQALPKTQGTRRRGCANFFTRAPQTHRHHRNRWIHAMKIEIAESLIFSWLRHVQGCVVTQMNWKPSPSWPISNDDELRQKFERIRVLAGESIGVPIFKKCEFAQFVRQTEIDVLGLRLGSDPAARQVLAVDSAFHGGGLLYGSADETVGRVLKKLIRAALAVEGYLNVAEAIIVFATPKVAESIREPIERHLASLEAALGGPASAGASLRFRLIANQDFADEIARPILETGTSVADTSELFLANFGPCGTAQATHTR
jgi:hypothetical protein